MIASSAVFDDGVEDTMWDDSGLVWFLAVLDRPLSTRDTVKDRTGTEVVNDTDRLW